MLNNHQENLKSPPPLPPLIDEVPSLILVDFFFWQGPAGPNGAAGPAGQPVSLLSLAFYIKQY